MEKGFDATTRLEWTYERKEGDLTVFACTKKEAIECLRQHGYLIRDPMKLTYKSAKTLADYMKAVEIK